MQRDERAYLNDIIEACAGIESALSGLISRPIEPAD
jgi:hypothetical protein